MMKTTLIKLAFCGVVALTNCFGDRNIFRAGEVVYYRPNNIYCHVLSDSNIEYLKNNRRKDSFCIKEDTAILSLHHKRFDLRYKNVIMNQSGRVCQELTNLINDYREEYKMIRFEKMLKECIDNNVSAIRYSNVDYIINVVDNENDYRNMNDVGFIDNNDGSMRIGSFDIDLNHKYLFVNRQGRILKNMTSEIKRMCDDYQRNNN